MHNGRRDDTLNPTVGQPNGLRLELPPAKRQVNRPLASRLARAQGWFHDRFQRRFAA